MTRAVTLFIVAILLCFSALACVSCSSTSSISKSKQDSLQKTLDEQLAKYKVPGAIVGMWFPDQGTWVVGSGIGDKSTGAAPQTSDKVRIGSITKTFTATVVLQLVDEKKLSLDDKLSKYEPQVPGGDGITIRQLLNMTSGLFNYTDDQAFWAEFLQTRNEVWPPQKMVDIAVAHPAVFPPGQRYMYCNTNYVLLGMIIEKVTGSTVGKQITTRIIDKLGLKNTSFPTTNQMPSPYMHGYLAATGQPNDNANVQDFSIYNPSPFWAAGAMIGNLDDLKVWAEALATGQLVSKAMHDEQVKFAPPNTSGYGLGVMGAAARLVGHSGEVPGYNSSMYYFPASKSMSIVLINRYPSKIEGLADVINGALVKVMVPTPASSSPK
jgi:D-alanyl-D-alanine carboxypeptidase